MRADQRYVPVLWWKLGEQVAVRHLTAHEKLAMAPLFQIFPHRPPEKVEARRPAKRRKKADWFVEMANTLERSWGYGEVFIEIRAPHEEPFGVDDSQPVVRILDELRAKGLRPIPVCRLSYGPARRTALRDALAQDGRGACMRLTRPNLERSDLKTALDELLADLSISTSEVDLLIDYEVVNEDGFDLVLLCALLPRLQEWRSFTVVGGAFPEDLSGPLQTPGRHVQPRHEWRAWRREIARVLPRTPAYGDYTMRYPYLPDSDRRMTPSASIRYTVQNDWIVMRGQQLNAERFVQYRANAQILRGSTDYRGESYSFGDRYLADVATEKIGTGNPQTWLTAGVNHHLTLVVDELATLFASLNAPEHKIEVVSAVPLPQAARTASPEAFQPIRALHRSAPTA